MYYIYDENGELMRKVKRKDEAVHIVELREGWTFKRVRQPRQDLSKYEDAPF